MSTCSLCFGMRVRFLSCFCWDLCAGPCMVQAKCCPNFVSATCSPEACRRDCLSCLVLGRFLSSVAPRRFLGGQKLGGHGFATNHSVIRLAYFVVLVFRGPCVPRPQQSVAQLRPTWLGITHVCVCWRICVLGPFLGRLGLGWSKRLVVDTWCPQSVRPRHHHGFMVLVLDVFGAVLGGDRNPETTIGHEPPQLVATWRAAFGKKWPCRKTGPKPMS